MKDMVPPAVTQERVVAMAPALALWVWSVLWRETREVHGGVAVDTPES